MCQHHTGCSIHIVTFVRSCHYVFLTLYVWGWCNDSMYSDVCLRMATCSVFMLWEIYNPMQFMNVCWCIWRIISTVHGMNNIKFQRSKHRTWAGYVVGIATVYGLDGPGFESRWGARFCAHVQTGCGAHPASCTMGTGSFPGVKIVTLTPHPLLVPWSRKSRAIPLLHLLVARPVQSLSACTRVHFTLPFKHRTTLAWTVTALLAGSPDIRAGAVLFSSAHTTNKMHITSYPGAEHSSTPELRIHASIAPLPHMPSWRMLNQE